MKILSINLFFLLTVTATNYAQPSSIYASIVRTQEYEGKVVRENYKVSLKQGKLSITDLDFERTEEREVDLKDYNFDENGHFNLNYNSVMALNDMRFYSFVFTDKNGELLYMKEVKSNRSNPKLKFFYTQKGYDLFWRQDEKKNEVREEDAALLSGDENQIEDYFKREVSKRLIQRLRYEGAKDGYEVEKKVIDESSWMYAAEYYSKPRETNGFLIITTARGDDYIYFEVPRYVWVEFKNSDSKGIFYNQNIKDKYTIDNAGK
mgnify:CR=1 FL=1